MTITTTDVKVLYEGDGATVLFNIPFEFFETSNVKVYLRNNAVDPYTETLLTVNIDYTLTNIVGTLPTKVTMGTAPADNSGGVGEQLLIIRVTPLTQNNTPDEAAVEEGLDRSTAASQELDERLDRTLTISPTETGVTTLQIPVDAGKFLKWKSDGTQIVTETISLTTIQSDISALQVADSALGVRLTAAEGDIDDLEAATVGIPAQILALQNAVSSSQTDIGNLQTDVANLTAALAITNATVAGLGNMFGTLEIQTILNNQSSPVTITALVFDGDVYTSILVEYELRRRTASQNLHSVGNLLLVFRDSAVWETERGLTSFDADGVTFTIVTSVGNIGTVKYISTDLTGGSYSGEIKMRIRKFEV